MRFVKCAIVVAAGLLIAVPASAQGPGRGFGGVVGQIGQNKQLQDELKLGKDQIEKVIAAVAKIREDLKDDVAKIRDRNTPQEERAEIMKKISDAEAKALGTILKADQVKRLNQIENQQAGIRMFAKEDVQKALKLSEDQREALKEIADDLQEKMRDLRGGFDPDSQKKRAALQKDAMNLAQKVLKGDQKSVFRSLIGEPFELTFAPQGFPQPGQVLSAQMQEMLKLTDAQKKQLEELQKDVDARLGKILTEEQIKQLKEPPRFGPPRGGQ